MRAKLLDRQLRRNGLSDDAAPSLSQWRQHLQTVEKTYDQADQDRYTLERSLDISSDEMRRLYEDLKRSSETALATEHEKLRKSLAIHEAILGAAPDGVCVVDEHRSVVSQNRRFAEVWGLTREDLHAPTHVRVRPRVRDPDAFLARIDQIYRSDAATQEEIELLDGRVLERVSVPVRSDDAGTVGRVWFFRDVTAHKEQEARLRAAKELAEKATRVKSDFLLNMSHEMRTPLNAILGFARIIDREAASRLGEELGEYLQNMVAAAEHMLALINDLLDLRSLEETTLPRVSLGLPDVIGDTLALVAPLIEERHLQLSLDVPGDIPPVLGNQRALQQILINLMSNAAKFTPAGGEISIGVSHIASRVHVAVSDTGIGIAPEDQVKLFTYFEQVGGKHEHHMKGTGVGLALTRALVERHGGSISVQSALGEGSTFKFDLEVAT